MTSVPELEESFFVEHFANILPCEVNEKLEINNQTLSVLHLNIRSLSQKMGQFELFLASLNAKFSCIILSETWFSCDTFLPQYYINGYNLFSNSRSNRNGGGIAIYVSQMFEASVTDIPLAGCEALRVQIGESGRDVCTVLAVYRAPSGSSAAFLGDLALVLPTLPRTYLYWRHQY